MHTLRSCFDGSVRTTTNFIVSWVYGGDGFDCTKIEICVLQFVFRRYKTIKEFFYIEKVFILLKSTISETIKTYSSFLNTLYCSTFLVFAQLDRYLHYVSKM